MDVEIFHLRQLVNQPYAGIVMAEVIALMAVCGAVGYLIYRRWIRPLVFWPVLFLFFFGFSQLFPENRPQYKEIAAIMVIPAGIFGWIVLRFIPDHRAKQERREKSNGPSGEQRND